MKIAILYLGILFVCKQSVTNQNPNLIESLRSELEKDQAFSAQERADYLKEFQRQLGAYAFDLVKSENRDALDTLMQLVTDGSFEANPIPDTVRLASMAYKAVRRGAPADFVEGISLYGFRKKIDADTIATWAYGVRDCISFKVPENTAKALVHQAAERGFDQSTFNILKWGLVQAVRAGYDPEAFAATMFYHAIEKNLGPGYAVAYALRRFRLAHQAGRKPKIPVSLSSRISLPQKSRLHEAIILENGPQNQIDPVSRLLVFVDSFMGSPYAWGGCTQKGTDCSGFVQAVYSQLGIQLPRSSRDMWRRGKAVAYKNLRLGDLVFFKTTSNRITHVGIVTDPEKKLFAHASSKRGVVVTNLEECKYYHKRYVGARRVLP